MIGWTASLVTTALLWAVPARPRILGIAQVSIAASDLARSRAYYEQFLGFDEVVPPCRISGSPVSATFRVGDYQVISVVPQVGRGTDRLGTISLYTNDAPGMRAYLSYEGTPLSSELTGEGAGDVSFSFTDPDHHKIEVVQYGRENCTGRSKARLTNHTEISRRIDHVGISVADAKAALRFYGGILGFRETLRGSPDGKVLSWINMRVPNGADCLELMLYKSGTPPEEIGRLNHVGLESLNVQAAVKVLQGRSYARGYGRPFEIVIGNNRRRHVNLFDPDGTRTELIEPSTVDGRAAVSSSAPLPMEIRKD